MTTTSLVTDVAAILDGPPIGPDDGDLLGTSRGGQAIRGFRLGAGQRRISLLAGCHADEPVGPRLLRHLVGYLQALPASHDLLRAWEWWIVPHINPDGAARNRRWQCDDDTAYDIAAYLRFVVRELPGDDIEFGFPRDDTDQAARPENRAVFDWWRGAAGAFAMHVSLHGMGFAAGPWFLIDAAWRSRCDLLMTICREATASLGYVLHDVERRGEKGFVRLARGFTTRPDSEAMRRHFLERGDEETADRFRPSSMETIRRFGGDALTLVSEMPLFLIPGVGEILGPPDPAAEIWRRRIDSWRVQLAQGADPAQIRKRALAAGLRPMPIRDQMNLQLVLIEAGMRQVCEIGGP